MPVTFLQFLDALGNAIINSFWQLGLLWLLVALIQICYKRIPPAGLSIISFFALFAGFVSFVATFVNSLLAPKMNAGIFEWITSLPLFQNVMAYAAILYILLLIFPVVKLTKGLYRVHQLKNSGLNKIPGHLKIFLLDAMAYSGVKRKVKLWISDLVDAPLTIGFFKPVILLPVAIVNHLSPHQVESIILHELAHIKRNDYLMNLLSQLILTFLYFNPFAKALANLQSIESEKTADNWVLRFGYSNYLYANTLLTIAKENQTDKFLHLALKASGNNMSLLNRIKWITGNGQINVPGFKKIIPAIMMIILAFGFLKIHYVPTNTGKAETNVAEKIALPVASFLYETNTGLENYKIQPIPVIISHKQVKKNTVYLRQFDDPVTGKLEIIVPETPDPIPTQIILVAQPTDVIPELSKEEEEKVQQYLIASKKIIANQSWKEIEKILAEAVTTEQKIKLKEEFEKSLELANWNKEANILRLSYNRIDWDKVNAKLNTAINNLKIDSIYNHYKAKLQKYQALQKNIENKNTMEETQGIALENELSQKIVIAEIIIKKADSLRKKRIVEL